MYGYKNNGRKYIQQNKYQKYTKKSSIHCPIVENHVSIPPFMIPIDNKPQHSNMHGTQSSGTHIR